ncbi:Probable 39S ribosomal protein L35, mitochondrial [Trichuris trichiura]|uniref:Probable 39S ribosomal protein L35, mitochondrial n=1 Tax=Trichuris trichiura TaxID=36087 RepID=A0A077Z1N7_TRITR|nr:Probable 39S ribosomal protein L35, mitochondrial [Trichuris trichiura]
MSVLFAKLRKHFFRFSLLRISVRKHARIPHWEYHIRFSPEDGRKVPCKDVLDRFKRLNTGMWIRANPGRNTKRYLKDEPWLTSSLQHVTCTPIECQILDKLVSRFWQRPKYFVDDQYEAYNVRHSIDGTKASPFFVRPRSRRKLLLEESTEKQFF